MPRRGPNYRLIPTLLAVLALAIPAAARTLETATGLRVTIHSAEEIEARWLVREGGRTILQHPVAGQVELDTVVHPWDDLTPMDAETVAAAVAAMHGFEADLAVEIFLLPGFPDEIFSSFARRESVFLAPAFATPAPETVAYVAAHELGHVLCWGFLDGRPERWEAYRELRRLAPQEASADTPHAERHREIIAEDIRFLFGGPLATVSGTIEHPGLPTPDAVAGLRELFVGYFESPAGRVASERPSRVYPNPCRHQAMVELDLPVVATKAGRGVPVLEIYDIRGRLVRRLAGGHEAAGRVTVVWDGTAQDGRRAAAGTYVYRIRHAGEFGSGRLVLLNR